MLPNVNTDDRNVSKQRVLVSSGRDLEAFGGGVDTLDNKLNQPVTGIEGRRNLQASPIQNLGYQQSSC